MSITLKRLEGSSESSSYKMIDPALSKTLTAAREEANKIKGGRTTISDSSIFRNVANNLGLQDAREVMVIHKPVGNLGPVKALIVLEGSYGIDAVRLGIENELFRADLGEAGVIVFKKPFDEIMASPKKEPARLAILY